jgi:3-oxoadipate enol-lactonase
MSEYTRTDPRGNDLETTMPIAHINGVDLYYERHGAVGEPLVLVHGYTGDVSDWRFQIAEFSRTHRVLAFDHRGHGRSAAPTDRSQYTIEQMADDVEALAAHIGFQHYHLLGHSMGGAIVQEVALRSRARLLSLTLQDCSIRPVDRSSQIAAVLAATHAIAEEQGMAAVAALHAQLPAPHMPAERRTEEIQRLTAMSVDAYIGAWQALEKWQGTAGRACRIAVPTMVIYGEHDGSFLVDAAHELAAAIPGARLEMVPHAGHSPQYERPEIFNAALRRHLERNAGAPRG